MCESIDLVILARVSLRFAIQNPNQILIPVGTPFHATMSAASLSSGFPL
jgi:hypothetical protein